MPTPPIPSKLDERQILQNVHDEATGTLRTTTQSTILNADIQVSIDSLDDSVAIKSSDGTRELKLETDGSINANTGNLLQGLKFDVVYATYNSTQDIYTYKLSVVTQATITVTYTDNTKTIFSSLVRI